MRTVLQSGPARDLLDHVLDTLLANSPSTTGLLAPLGRMLRDDVLVAACVGVDVGLLGIFKQGGSVPP